MRTFDMLTKRGQRAAISHCLSLLLTSLLQDEMRFDDKKTTTIYNKL